MQKRVLVLTGGIVAASLLLFAPAGLAASAGDGAGSPQAGVGALQQRVAASFAQTARQHLDAGRIKEAIEDFTAALSFDPAHSGAREGLVLADARLGEAAGAAKPPAPKPARPANADIIRAQASLTVMNASARQLLARGDYSAAADTYGKVLAGAKPLARHVDVSAVTAEAERGLAKARSGMQAKKAEPVVERKPEAPKPKVSARAAANTEARPGLGDDYETAMEEAMRDVGRMMRPQTRILAKDESPVMVAPFTRKRRDHTTDVIATEGFRGARDEGAEKRIQAQLLKKVSMSFKDQPFASAIDYIRASCDVNIFIDPAVLPMTKPADFNVVNMELRHVLNYLLRFQKLDYRIRDGAIFISSGAGLADRPVMMLHNITDLTVTIRNFGGRDSLVDVIKRPDRDDDYIRRMGIERAKDDHVELQHHRRGGEWAKFIRDNVCPMTWAGEGGVAQNTIAYRNGKLVVTHTAEVQEQIRELLASFRKARALQVAILARFVEISENFLDDFGIEYSGLGADGDIGFRRTGSTNTVAAGSIVNDPEVGLGTSFLSADGLTLNLGFLHKWEVQALITAVRKENRGNILTAPRVTCFNTQRAFMTVATIRSFIRSYNSDGQPEIGQVNDGIVLEVQPFVSADRRYITLELIPQVNMVGDFTEFTYRRDITDDLVDDDVADDLTETDRVQLPEVTTRQVMTTVSVPDGGTLMIGGLAQAREGEGTSTVPFLGDLPLIKYLFTSHRKLDARNNLIILVTAHIIQQDED